MRHISEFCNEALREAFEESAGIIERCANRSGADAEAAAMEEVNERRARQDAVDRDKVQR